MICPACGKWNRTHFKACRFCGEELPEEQTFEPEWRSSLKDDQRGKEYIRVNDEGQAQATPDPRDTLAQEMSELKVRKATGRELQRQLREESAERGSAPSSQSVRTSSATDGLWEISGTARFHVPIDSEAQ